MKPLVLMVDDDAAYAGDMASFLASDFTTRVVTDPRDCLPVLQQEAPLVVLMDLELGDGVTGIDLLTQIRTWDADLPVIFLTRSNRAEDAVEALKQGAYHYLVKSKFSLDELRCTMRRAINEYDVRRELDRTRGEIEELRDPMIGNSMALTEVIEAARRVAPTDATVLITGESGTGKEQVARLIARESPRASGPFIAVNCASVPENLIESDFFGHEPGAFTDARKRRQGWFELATGGTLFLDEVGDTSDQVQAKVLRALQERSFYRVGGEKPVRCDVRVIAATNRDPEADVKQGRLRADLFYRLNVFRVHVPPLRERREDIPDLAAYFSRKYALEMRRPAPVLDAEAMDDLCRYPWPGNVREIQNAMMRAVIDAVGGPLERQHFAFFLPGESVSETYEDAKQRVLESFKRRYITGILRSTAGNVTRAAERSGLPRQSLQKMKRELGLDPETFRS